MARASAGGEATSLRRRQPINFKPEREPRSGLSVERESLQGLFPRLRLLLCAIIARVSGLRAGAGFGFKIIVKLGAGVLLAGAFLKASWQGGLGGLLWH